MGSHGSVIQLEDKRKLYCPSAKEDFATILPVATHGIKALGTPIGSLSYIESMCEAIAENGICLCSMLSYLNEPQSGLLLLRHCHVPKMNHFARTMAPKSY